MNVLLYRNLSAEQLATLAAEFPAVTFRTTAKAAEFEAMLDWPEVIFGNVPAALAARSPNLRWLQIISSGIDDYLPLTGTRVIVSTAHGLHAAIIAQHTLLMILLFDRGQLFFAQAQRDKKWERRPAVPHRIEGRHVVVLGAGAIAHELARIATPLGLHVTATRRGGGDSSVKGLAVAPWEQLDTLLGTADHIVITLPLTAATRGALGSARIARIQPGAFVHNVGRGGLIDDPALLAALHAGQLGGAALDVFETEPLPPDSPWWTAPNTIVTPHIAGHHRDLNSLTLGRFRANLRRYLSGEPVQPLANFTRGY